MKFNPTIDRLAGLILWLGFAYGMIKLILDLMGVDNEL